MQPFAPTEIGTGGRIRALATAVARRVRAEWRLISHRRAVGRLADLDERGLADIGLTPEDVRRALAVPFHVDPSRVLAVRRVGLRARDRNAGQRRAAARPARAMNPA